MESSESFEQELRDLLAHLYDPDLAPSAQLCEVLGCDPRDGPASLQARIARAIEGIRPPEGTPAASRTWRTYGILFHRYVENMTQEDAAECLGITARHLRRQQHAAIGLLANRLWWQYRSRQQQASSAPRLGETEPAGDLAARLAGWRSQVQQEVAALQRASRGNMAGVHQSVLEVIETARDLAARHGVSLAAGSIDPAIAAAIHPSALRQVLLSATMQLLREMSSGAVAYEVSADADVVRIVVAGEPIAGTRLPEVDFAQEILSALDGVVTLHKDGARMSISLELPVAGRIVVLVVDDNVDLVHFYRRYVAETCYEIVHVARGQEALALIETSRPDIIVLDVMLPDVDGWSLLSHLYENPASRTIPIIVCSVVREEELALALGAALYIPKPVRRREFLEALEKAISRAVPGDWTPRRGSAAPC